MQKLSGLFRENAGFSRGLFANAIDMLRKLNANCKTMVYALLKMCYHVDVNVGLWETPFNNTKNKRNRR